MVVFRGSILVFVLGSLLLASTIATSPPINQVQDIDFWIAMTLAFAGLDPGPNPSHDINFWIKKDPELDNLLRKQELDISNLLNSKQEPSGRGVSITHPQDTIRRRMELEAARRRAEEARQRQIRENREKLGKLGK